MLSALVPSSAHLIATDPTPALPSGWSAVAIAAIGAIPPLAALWLQARSTGKKVARAEELAAQVVDSVGPKNGHGTVQDLAGRLYEEFRDWRDEVRADLASMHDTQRAMQTSLDSVVGAAENVNERLKHHDRELGQQRRRLDDHDREHAEHRRRLDDHEQRLPGDT